MDWANLGQPCLLVRPYRLYHVRRKCRCPILLQFALQAAGTFQTLREAKKWIIETDSIPGILFEVTTRTRLASSVENLGFLSASRTWATPVTSTHSFRSGSTTRSSGRRSTHGTRSKTKRRRTTRSAQ